ncbi:hypothetical protein ABNP43_00915 [Bacillus altitudinis]|uniref:hypothetical protein n=1 Tax=Bacillus altitudinis TaxID=293387 RepID=UPI0032EE2481
MRYSVYQPNSSKWFDVKATNTDAFLKDYRFVLDDRLIRESIKWLKGYGVKHLEQLLMTLR